MGKVRRSDLVPTWYMNRSGVIRRVGLHQRPKVALENMYTHGGGRPPNTSFSPAQRRDPRGQQVENINIYSMKSVVSLDSQFHQSEGSYEECSPPGALHFGCDSCPRRYCCGLCVWCIGTVSSSGSPLSQPLLRRMWKSKMQWVPLNSLDGVSIHPNTHSSSLLETLPPSHHVIHKVLQGR